MTKKLLHLTAVQLFLLFIGLPVLLNIIDLIFSPSVYFSYYYVSPLITLIGLGLLFSWYWTIGVNLYERLPQGIVMNLHRFKLLLLASFFLISLTVFLQFLLSVGLSANKTADWFLVIFIPQILAMPCMFYCIYFIAKALKTVEANRQVTSNDYSGKFLMLLFFPIGVWFIQPIIKKLFEEKEKSL